MPAPKMLALIASQKRAELDPALTAAEFQLQWHNPKEVTAVLLIIGGEIVQKALAQLTGGRIVPVAFSFGWVAYAFSTIVAMVGEGRLMPEPDYPCKVINTENGYTRENRSWIIGRMLRDSEPALDGESLVVEVFVARKYANREGRLKMGECKRGWSFWIGICTIFVQLGVAAIPFGLYEDWGVFMITGAGTILALITGWLPQWRAEKLACRKDTNKTIAITKGNGSRYVMVILGCRRGLDLEDLAASESPRMKRPWEKYGLFTTRPSPPNLNPSTTGTNLGKEVALNKGASQVQVVDDSDLSEPDIKPPPAAAIKVYTWRDLPLPSWLTRTSDLPLDFWLTRTICLTLIVAWTTLLISAAALDENAWYLLAVGAIGMAQNAIVAGVRRGPEKHGIHLKKIHTEGKKGKVMDVLMDIESAYPGKNIGRSLVDEFFPGKLKDPEVAWWKGNMKAYDDAREERLDGGVPWNRRTDAEKVVAQRAGRANAAKLYEKKEKEKEKAEATEGEKMETKGAATSGPGDGPVRVPALASLDSNVEN